MRKTLLVPTDFSQNAWVATQYAVNLALKYGYDIYLLNVYQAMRRALAGQQFNEALELHAAEKANNNMQELTERIQDLADAVHVTSACIEGDLSTIVLDIIEERSVSFVVMGTKGATGFKHVALGSNTFEIIQKSPIGVLAVPEIYEGFQLEKIGLLSNFKESEIELLQSFTGRLTTGLDVVMMHVEEADKKKDVGSILYWVEHVRQAIQVESVTFRSNEAIKRLDISETIPQCINKLVEEEKIDVLLVSYNRKSFFKQLFSKSLTKVIAHNLSVPAYFKREV